MVKLIYGIQIKSQTHGSREQKSGYQKLEVREIGKTYKLSAISYEDQMYKWCLQKIFESKFKYSQQ